MPFIGTTPAQGFASIFNKQTFTANGSTTSFTLNHRVNNANDLEVFVGNVRQEPTEAYSASGLNLTMTEAPANGVSFYVIYKGLAQITTSPSDGSVGVSQLQNNAITTAKIANNAITSAILPTGSVLQVQSVNHKGELTTSSTSHTPITELAVTITPTSTSSKVLLMFQGYLYTSTWTRYLTMSAQRNIGGAGATDISGTTLYTDNNADGLLRTYDADSHVSFRNGGFNFVDSPNTTSSIVYNPTFRRGTDSATCYIGHANMITTFIAMEIA